MSDNGVGWNAWPYPVIDVDVVGWAVKDRSLLQWSDTSVDVYVNQLDGGQVAQCSPDCGRFFHHRTTTTRVVPVAPPGTTTSRSG